VIGPGSGGERPGVGDALVRAVGVVEDLVNVQRVQQVPLVEDQGAVERFAPAGPHPAFHPRVHPGDADAAEYDRDAGVGEDGVEHGRVLAVPIADQVLHPASRVPIYVILDNLFAHKGAAVIKQWVARNRVELCFTPTYASWANLIEAHFGPLRTFVIAESDHENHVALGRHMHQCLRWRNANARHPDVLAAQRRERARVRSERQHRWGHPATKAA
jgi:hypothetical protein